MKRQFVTYVPHQKTKHRFSPTQINKLQLVYLLKTTTANASEITSNNTINYKSTNLHYATQGSTPSSHLDSASATIFAFPAI